MRLWRISAYPGLEGTGGHHSDGRWHTQPRSVFYAAEHPALAMIEVMAHLHLTADKVPTTLKLLCIDIAHGALQAASPALPAGWQANTLASQTIGNAWLDAGNELLLPVPSALVAHATNYVINAAHPQARTHLVETIEPFWFDPRYFTS